MGFPNPARYLEICRRNWELSVIAGLSLTMLALGVTLGVPESARFDDLRARMGRELEGGVARPGRFEAPALRSLVEWALPNYSPDAVDRLARRLERDTAGIPLLAVAMVEGVRTARVTAAQTVCRGLGVHRSRALGWTSKPV